LKETDSVDFVFFDGNHRFEATWDYFSLCLKKAHNDSIFIFDDIHWSDEMERVWYKILMLEEVKVSIDLFRMGIIFFKKELSKQNFIIRY
jgi:predicted O-methyltransferase YrrM